MEMVSYQRPNLTGQGWSGVTHSEVHRFGSARDLVSGAQVPLPLPTLRTIQPRQSQPWPCGDVPEMCRDRHAQPQPIGFLRVLVLIHIRGLAVFELLLQDLTGDLD